MVNERARERLMASYVSVSGRTHILRIDPTAEEVFDGIKRFEYREGIFHRLCRIVPFTFVTETIVLD